MIYEQEVIDEAELQPAILRLRNSPSDSVRHSRQAGDETIFKLGGLLDDDTGSSVDLADRAR